MDFNLPEELQMLKDTVRKFVDKELIPVEMHTIEIMELTLVIGKYLALGRFNQVLGFDQTCTIDDVRAALAHAH